MTIDGDTRMRRKGMIEEKERKGNREKKRRQSKKEREKQKG